VFGSLAPDLLGGGGAVDLEELDALQVQPGTIAWVRAIEVDPTCGDAVDTPRLEFSSVGRRGRGGRHDSGAAVSGSQTFGAVLRGFRRRARLTQEGLAERSGVSVRTIRSLEGDRPSTPRFSSVRALAEALDLDAGERQRFERLADLHEQARRMAAAAIGGSIPVPLSQLVGRDAELSRLVEVVLGGRTRLVTLTGVAGIGKTRLALAVADAAAGRGRRAWWVPLSGVGEPRYVLDAVAGALGVSEVTVEAIGTRLGGEPALLVVDNFEQVDGVGHVLTELLQRVPEVTALVTSRAPIGLPDEQAWPVRPLAVPGDVGGLEDLESVSSVELLVDRIRRTTPDFDLSPDTAAAVGEVCRRLDGLPLALELAAGSWRVLGPRGVLDAISADPLDVHDLQGVRPAAHSSLRSALDASYGLLTAETRHVLHGLSVFRGGWTIEAATEVVGRGSVLDHLDRLAALGLVETSDASGWRFSMLPTIQAFAAAHARDTGVADRATTRHADYFRRWVSDLQHDLAAASKIVFQRLSADRDNLRAALEWFEQHDAATGLAFAMDLYRYWLYRGSLDEGLAWFEALLQRAGAVDHAPLARLYAASLANYGGHPTVSRGLAAGSRETFRRRGDAHGVALASVALAELDLRGSLEESVRLSREAAATLESIGDLCFECWALSTLASGLAQLGALAEAEDTARRAVAIARQHAFPYRLATGLAVLADILRLRGDLTAVDRLGAESVSPLLTGLDDLDVLWFAERAVAVAGLGEVDRARDLASVALTKATQLGNGTAMGAALWAEGEVRLTAGEEAAGSFARAFTNLRRHGRPLLQIEVLTGLALAVDDVEIAAAATAAAGALRDDQHMVLPAGVAARLDRICERWAPIVGADRWALCVGDMSARPHDELPDLLVRAFAAQAA
jgi:predicted ATPase/transcriptional regulator with XRE-family HTH domain